MRTKQPTIEDIYMADAYITTPGVRQGLLERAAEGNDDEVITEDTDDGQVVYYRTPYGEMMPVGRPAQMAPVGPPGTRPGDVLVAEVGSRNLPEQAYSGRYPDTIKPVDPTARQQLADFLQAGFEKFGMDRYRARKQAQTLMGGESSNLPIALGLADIVPFLGTALQTQEAARMGEEAVQSAQQGNIGTAAIQAGGAVLGMVPGAVGTVKAARKVGGMAGEAIDQAMTQGTGPAASIIPQAVRPLGMVGNDVSYRSSHAAPNREFGATLDDLTGGGQIYPADVYSKQGPRIYGTGTPYDKKAFDIANKAKGNPDAEVTIYRAVPSEVTSTEINRGDWVAITQEYARDHGESVLRGEYKIITKKVKARDIYTNGDSIQEWGYDPAEKGTK